jgi:hypothetical protein
VCVDYRTFRRPTPQRNVPSRISPRVISEEPNMVLPDQPDAA